MKRSGLRDPGSADTRVLMWVMNSREASDSIWFGALEDGTVFRRVGGDQWATLLAGPRDVDDSFRLLVEKTRLHEDSMVMAGPAEFSIEEALAANIRLGVMWDSTEPILMIGFDMALKVGK